VTLEIKKLEVEKLKVAAAKAEMEMRIYESEENIQRLRVNMENQDKRIEQIEKELKTLKQ
jgi:predicted RNase H-like nuclease (RuvC/YqgF family)